MSTSNPIGRFGLAGRVVLVDFGLVAAGAVVTGDLTITNLGAQSRTIAGIAGAPQSDDPKLMDCWGGALGASKGLLGKFGKQRVLDTPISESAFMGAAELPQFPTTSVVTPWRTLLSTLGSMMTL